MPDTVIVVPKLDPAADRRDAHVLAGAAVVMWASLIALLAILNGLWMRMLWLIVPVGALALLWTILATRARDYALREEPDLVARVHEGYVELGTPVMFQRRNDVRFSCALPVNLGVTRRKDGLRSSTRWLISSDEANVTFATKGLAPVEAESLVTRGLVSLGLAVDTVYSDRSTEGDG